MRNVPHIDLVINVIKYHRRDKEECFEMIAHDDSAAPGHEHRRSFFTFAGSTKMPAEIIIKEYSLEAAPFPVGNFRRLSDFHERRKSRPNKFVIQNLCAETEWG